jgi:hypothetical protein
MEKIIEKPKRLRGRTLFGVFIFFWFIFFAIYFTPNFAADNFSPDGILEQTTLFRINLLRLAVIVLSIIGLLVSILYIIKPELFHLIQLKFSSFPISSDLRSIILVILIFLSLYLIFPLLIGILIAFLDLGSYNGIEYRPSEQLSKYYILITILVSIHSYATQQLASRVKLSICFLLFGVVLYLSESNMIQDTTQPIFGFIILSYTFFLLAKNREWVIFFLLSIGCIIFSITVLNDLVWANKFRSKAEFITLLSGPIYDCLCIINFEEILEPIAAAFVCLCIIIYSIESLTKFFQNNKYKTFFILFSAGIIVSGNSYLHWEHKPDAKLTLIAITLTIIGFFGLIIISRAANKEHTVISLPILESFSLFLLSFFVVLPAVFGRSNNIISIVVWLPTIIFFAMFLYSNHPCNRKVYGKEQQHSPEKSPGFRINHP